MSPEPHISTLRLTFVILFAWLIAWPPRVLAQEPLTWEQCVLEAAEYNPELTAARASVRRAQFQHRGSYSNFFPQLSFDSAYSGSRLGSSLFGPGINDEFSLGFTLSQNLFSGFRNTAQVELTLAELEAARADRLAVKAQVSFDLKSAFAELLHAQEQVELTKAIADRRKENVDLVELRFEAGREHKGSFLRSRAAHSQAEFEVTQAKRTLSVAQRALASVFGRRTFDALLVTGYFDITHLQESSPDFQALAKQTPAHLQPAAQTRVAEAALTAAQGTFYPEIFTSGSISRLGSAFPVDSSSWSAGIFLTVPLFSGGQRYYNLQSARAEYLRRQENLRSADDQTILELQRRFATFQDNVERVKVRQEFLDAAVVRAEIARSLYTSGLLSFEDWDLIENDLISAKKEMLASQRDWLIAEADWERAQGHGSIP